MSRSLQDVKVGDRVVVRTYGWGGGRVDATVTKVTKLHFTIDKQGGEKWKKGSGRRVGAGTWDTASVSFPLEGELDEIKAEVAAKNAKLAVLSYIEGLKEKGDDSAFLPLFDFITLQKPRST